MASPPGSGGGTPGLGPLHFKKEQCNVSEIPLPAYWREGIDDPPRVYTVTVPRQALGRLARVLACVNTQPTASHQFVSHVRCLHALLSLLEEPATCTPDETKKKKKDGEEEEPGKKEPEYDPVKELGEARGKLEPKSSVMWRRAETFIREGDKITKVLEQPKLYPRWQIAMERVMGREGAQSQVQAWRYHIVLFDDKIDLNYGLLFQFAEVRINGKLKRGGPKGQKEVVEPWNGKAWLRDKETYIMEFAMQYRHLTPEQYSEAICKKLVVFSSGAEGAGDSDNPASCENVFSLDFSITQAGLPSTYDESQISLDNYLGVMGKSVLRLPKPEHVFLLNDLQWRTNTLFFSQLPDLLSDTAFDSEVFPTFWNESHRDLERLNRSRRIVAADGASGGGAAARVVPWRNCWDDAKDSNAKQLRLDPDLGRKFNDWLSPDSLDLFGNETLADGGVASVRACHRYFLDREAQAQSEGKPLSLVSEDVPCYDASIRPYGNLLVHEFMELEAAGVKVAHRDIVCGRKAGLMVFADDHKLRVNYLRTGTEQSGKSYILDWIADCWNFGTYIKAQKVTAQALNVGAPWDQMRVMMHELEGGILGMKPDGSQENTGRDDIKTAMTEGWLTRHAPVQDPVTGEFHTGETRTRMRIEVQGNTNLTTEGANKAATSRWVVVHCVDLDRPGYGVAEKDFSKELAEDKAKRKERLRRYLELCHKLDWGTMVMHKLVSVGKLPEPSIWYGVGAFLKVFEHLRERGLVTGENTRKAGLFQSLCRTLTLEKAFFNAFCTSIDFKPGTPFSWSQFRATAKYLVADPDVVVQALTMILGPELDPLPARAIQAFVQSRSPAFDPSMPLDRAQDDAALPWVTRSDLDERTYLGFYVQRINSMTLLDAAAQAVWSESSQFGSEVRDSEMGVRGYLMSLRHRSFGAAREEDAKKPKVLILDDRQNQILVHYEWLVWTFTDEFKNLMVDSLKAIQYRGMTKQRAVTTVPFVTDPKMGICPQFCQVVDLSGEGAKVWEVDSVYTPDDVRADVLMGGADLLEQMQTMRIDGDMEEIELEKLLQGVGWIDANISNEFPVMPLYGVVTDWQKRVVKDPLVAKWGDYPGVFVERHRMQLRMKGVRAVLRGDRENRLQKVQRSNSLLTRTDALSGLIKMANQEVTKRAGGDPSSPVSPVSPVSPIPPPPQGEGEGEERANKRQRIEVLDVEEMGEERGGEEEEEESW